MAHLREGEFGLEIKIDLVGYVRFQKAFDNRHEAKAKAGKIFHLDYVKSVFVHDCDGVGWLYLKKNVDGTVYREERNPENGCLDITGVNLKR